MAIDFPSSPATDTLYAGPNGQTWRWDGVKWVPYSTTGIEEAPADHVTYGRKDGVWNPALALTGDILDGGNF